MVERSHEPTTSLFELSPTPTLIFPFGDEPIVPRMNRAAQALLEDDDGRSAATLSALGRAARGEIEPLRRARLSLPHRPGRLYSARAMPLDARHTAVLVDDITEAYGWRTSLSVFRDIIDRLGDAFIVCAVSDRHGDPRALPVIALNARARSLAGAELSGPETALGDAVSQVFTADDFDRLSASLARCGDPDRETSWRIERTHTAWNCQVWCDGQRMTMRLQDVSEAGHLARALSDHARLLRAANEELDDVMRLLREHVRAPMREARRLLMPAPGAPAPSLRDRQRLQHLCTHIDRLLGELVAYVGITRTPLTGGTVDLERVVQRVLADPELHGEAGAAIDAGSLPTVWGQERLFELLFRQLFAAALTHSSDRAPGSITVESAHTGADWRIAVQLGPSAVDPGLLDGLLQSGRLGHGLGLAICRRIVEYHGGRIGTKTTERSTTIWFELPPARPFG